MSSRRKPKYDVFLSHSHEDAEWIEALARRLEDEHKFRVWLDKWRLIPGKSWQQEMARGLEETATCAACIGGTTPEGWFREEVERALDLQTKNEDFRVIPVLLPDAAADVIPAFVRLRTWADFRTGQDEGYAYHVLVQGIRGLPVGRWPPNRTDRQEQTLGLYKAKIEQLQQLKVLGLHEEVVIEFETKILDRWLEEQD